MLSSRRLPNPFRRSTGATEVGTGPISDETLASGANWWRPASASPRLVGAILSLSLVAVGATVYLTPSAKDSDHSGLRAAPAPTHTVTAPPSPHGGAAADGPVEVTPSNAAEVKISRPSTKTVVVRTTVPATPKPIYCSQFSWQQDAQAAYLANLSDPWGLDGAPGPNNGDGLACTILPVDPARPASTPAGAYVPPAVTAASKAELLSPAVDYYGVSQDGLPNAGSQFNALATSVGKAPSSVGYFQYWNHPFDPSKVTSSWSRAALPVITWMSKADVAAVAGQPCDPVHLQVAGCSDTDFNLNAINRGDWDNYIRQYAIAISKLNLPVAIRFDHEMNGNWYPWSAGKYGNANTDPNTNPNAYVRAWRHVWTIFENAGANEDVIWLWSPGRIDNVSGNQTTQLQYDYPGDAYVDWVGATVYWRSSSVPTDFDTSFKKTIDKIRTLTNKPLFFAEIGAIQATANGTDLTAQKTQWMQNTMAGFLANTSIVGFSWFDNIATTADDPNNPHDWRINSSAGTLSAFKTLVADPRFKSGTMPDSTS